MEKMENSTLGRCGLKSESFAKKFTPFQVLGSKERIDA
jgi:hypothetical protein